MQDIILFDGNVFSVPDDCYFVVKKYIERVNQIDCIHESYGIVLPQFSNNSYKVSIECIVEDCSDKWLTRIDDMIDVDTSDYPVLARLVRRSDFECGFKITRGFEHLRVKVQDCAWHGFIGDIPRCKMVDIGNSVFVSEYKSDKLCWYRQNVFSHYKCICKVFIIGSVLRNWCTQDSDIDMLVVCDNGTDCDDILGQIDMEYDAVAADDILVCTVSEYDTAVHGFIKSVKEEGEVLYAR